MKRIYIILFILFGTNALLADNSNLSENDLKDLPNWNLELKRWFLPLDKWHTEREYLMKGNYLDIKIAFDSSGLQIPESLSFYESQNFKNAPAFTVALGDISQNNKSICTLGDPSGPVELLKYIKCGKNFCTEGQRVGPLNSMDPEIYKGSGLVYKLVNQINKQKTCPFDLDFIVRKSEPNDKYIGRNISFKISDSISSVTDVVKINVAGKDFYLDAKVCTKDLGKCQILNVPHSKFEKDWQLLKSHMRNKDVNNLNGLIKDLVPCLEKKDGDCIKSSFLKIEEMNPSTGLPLDGKEFVVDEAAINELKACLRYESLLPHMMGLRGINKVCIFNPAQYFKSPLKKKAKFLSLAYPEAIREDLDIVFYFKMDEKDKSL